MSQTDNRTKLLNTACELFAARSYDAVGVQEVVSRAGLSKPTLYHYFGNKEGLLSALLEARFSLWLQNLESKSRYQGNLVASLENLASTWLEQSQADTDWFYLLLALSSVPLEHPVRPLIAPWLQKQQKLIEQLLIDAVPQHGNLKGHHPILALTLQGWLYQTTRALLSGDLPLKSDSIHKLIKQFMYGIYVL